MPHVIRSGAQASVLLDEARRSLVEQLAGGPDSASGLARRLGLPRQRVNYHLRALEKAGLVELVEERRKGNCVERVVRAVARSYFISPEALGALGRSLEEAQDRLSAAYLVAAAARTIREVTDVADKASAAGRRAATLTLDADIRFRTAAERRAFAEELTETIANLVARYNDETAPGSRSFRLLVGAYPASQP